MKKNPFTMSMKRILLPPPPPPPVCLPLPAPLPPPTPSSIIGYSNEITAIERSLFTLHKPVLVCGPPGIGKTCISTHVFTKHGYTVWSDWMAIDNTDEEVRMALTKKSLENKKRAVFIDCLEAYEGKIASLITSLKHAIHPCILTCDDCWDASWKPLKLLCDVVQLTASLDQVNTIVHHKYPEAIVTVANPGRALLMAAGGASTDTSTSVFSLCQSLLSGKYTPLCSSEVDMASSILFEHGIQSTTKLLKTTHLFSTIDTGPYITDFNAEVLNRTIPLVCPKPYKRPGFCQYRPIKKPIYTDVATAEERLDTHHWKK